MQPQRRRNRVILGILALGLLAGGALTAGPAQAVDAVGPYYALPSWDQKLPAATRFVVLTNWGSQAVLDKETGLVWEKTPSITLFNWGAAGEHCTNATTTGNRKGWRLPSVHELRSLNDPSVAPPGPTLPPGHPFTTGATGVQSAFYWSATTERIGGPGGAWAVNFENGLVGPGDKDRDDGHTWCVRGGMNADQY